MTHETDKGIGSDHRYDNTVKHEYSRGLCKGICDQYKATKPLFIGRYAANQVRCQVCEIFLTSDGVELKNGAPYCKCCHYRARTKPRNSFYKDRFHERISEMKDKPQSGDEKEFLNKSKQEKKSTPFYYRPKQFAKTYYELKEFIESGITAHANYQYVMIKHLLLYDNKLRFSHTHKGKIAESLALYNNKDPSNIEMVKKFLTVPVFEVLEKSGYVIKSFGSVSVGDRIIKIASYHLDVDLEEFQLIDLDSLLEKKIEEWNKEHEISAFNSNYEYDDIDWDKNGLLLEEKVQEDTTNEDIINEDTIDDEKKVRGIVDPELNRLEQKKDSKLIVKECHKCHYKIIGEPSEELINQIDKSFGGIKIHTEDGSNSEICRKCRTAETAITRYENEIAQMSLFYPENDGIHIKHFEIKNSQFIAKGQNLSNDELISLFEVGNMGGIRYSSKNNLIVLCDTASGEYEDIIDKDFQIIYYTGEGQIGDQTLSGGNQRIANSEGMPIFYFIEVPQQPGQKRRGALDNIYRYIGKVRYVKHVSKSENDIQGNPRQVIKFLLEIEK